MGCAFARRYNSILSPEALAGIVAKVRMLASRVAGRCCCAEQLSAEHWRGTSSNGLKPSSGEGGAATCRDANARTTAHVHGPVAGRPTSGRRWGRSPRCKKRTPCSAVGCDVQQSDVRPARRECGKACCGGLSVLDCPKHHPDASRWHLLVIDQHAKCRVPLERQHVVSVPCPSSATLTYVLQVLMRARRGPGLRAGHAAAAARSVGAAAAIHRQAAHLPHAAGRRVACHASARSVPVSPVCRSRIVGLAPGCGIGADGECAKPGCEQHSQRASSCSSLHVNSSELDKLQRV